MKHLYLKIIAIALFFTGLTGLQAQKVNVDVWHTYSIHVIDGVEEETWDMVDPVNFVLRYGNEQPTVTAYWKALWDFDYIYVLINVEDDDHYPSWEAGGMSWEYDKPEIYFDVNDTLVDGLGPVTPGSGHYQFSPGFTSDGYDIVHTDSGTAQSPAAIYAYTLIGESYVYEQAITISSMSNKHGVVMDGCHIPENVGFDATIVDQDEGITTVRQRAIWQSGDDLETEAWNNMDACGTIALNCYDCCWEWPDDIDEFKTVNLAVHPNPVTGYLTIDADFDKVVIHNILGQEISSMNQIKTNKLDVGYLSKGFYILSVYKSERYIGDARFMKI